MTAQTFDYVIIGGGSAGCVMAARLSEDPSVSVCLLESGKKDTSKLIHAPAGLAVMVPHGINGWHYETVEQAQLNNRRALQPRGKVLGGSSSINAMVYIRGNAWDYDNWASLGNDGWSYQDVLPYFIKAENNQHFKDDPFHGNDGPLVVSEVRSPSIFNQYFLSACNEQGIETKSDLNGQSQEGCRYAQVTQVNGQRCSAAKAYITPNLSRSNLTVITGAHVERLAIKDRRVTGVHYRVKGQSLEVRANEEVILSSGSFGSPQVLMLSGIGPKEHLSSVGIETIIDLPGVGSNLQDHLTVVPIYRTKETKGTFGISLRSCYEIPKGIMQWAKSGEGIIASNFAESHAFVKTDPNSPIPDIQLEFVIGMVDDHSRKLHMGHGYSIHASLMRPKSRGTVRLADKEPSSAPLIDPNYLSDPRDLDSMLLGLKKTLEVMESSAFDGVKGEMVYPIDRHDDKSLIEFIRVNGDTEYHPVSTCKMGVDSDEMAVVNGQLKVRGLDNLRVIDASVMPALVTGNTNAPTIMIAEKAADMVKLAYAANRESACG